MKNYLCILIGFIASFSFAQTAEENELFTSKLADSSEYRLVIKTTEFNGERDEPLDNMTIKWNGENARVFYTRYGDMMISNVTIPWTIVERIKKFEAEVGGLELKDPEVKYHVIFYNGDEELMYPIDVLNVELVSSLMLEFEE